MSVKSMTDLPEHVRRNRDHWDQLATTYVAAGERAWASNVPSWGIWSVPESEVGMFPDDLAGPAVFKIYPFSNLAGRRRSAASSSPAAGRKLELF
jgi:hypothetical protein